MARGNMLAVPETNVASARATVSLTEVCSRTAKNGKNSKTGKPYDGWYTFVGEVKLLEDEVVKDMLPWNGTYTQNGLVYHVVKHEKDEESLNGIKLLRIDGEKKIVCYEKGKAIGTFKGELDENGQPSDGVMERFETALNNTRLSGKQVHYEKGSKFTGTKTYQNCNKCFAKVCTITPKKTIYDNGAQH